MGDAVSRMDPLSACTGFYAALLFVCFGLLATHGSLSSFAMTFRRGRPSKTQRGRMLATFLIPCASSSFPKHMGKHFGSLAFRSMWATVLAPLNPTQTRTGCYAAVILLRLPPFALLFQSWLWKVTLLCGCPRKTQRG